MKFARWLWVASFIAALVILLGSLPGYWKYASQIAVTAEFSGIQQFMAWLNVFLSMVCVVLCLALAALLFVRKPNDAMALFLSAYLLMYGIFLAGPLEMFLPFWFVSTETLALAIQAMAFPLPSLILFLVFPNGRFAPRWTRWLIVLAAVFMLWGFATIRDADEINRMNSFAAQILFGMIGIMLILSLGAQFYRYRRVYQVVERQQTKWVVYGFVLSYAVLALVSIPYYYVQNLPPGETPWWAALNGMGWWLGLSIQPLSITLAILRYRLFDIDVIIRRTLTWTIMTAVLALSYLGSVVFLQQILRPLIGAGSDLAIIISTLAIAAMFNPLRNRVQGAIDHRFYRRKYDARKVLERFAQTARDEVELEKLTGELLTVVDETMQPSNVSLWLKKPE